MPSQRFNQHAPHRPAPGEDEDYALIDLQFNPDVDAARKTQAQVRGQPAPFPGIGIIAAYLGARGAMFASEAFQRAHNSASSRRPG